MTKPFMHTFAQTSLWAMAIAAAAPAYAQTPAQQEEAAPAGTPSEVNDQEIVVTGSQIRGIKAVGTNVVAQTRQDIQATGVTDTRQVIGQLPQSNFFLSLPSPGGGVIGAGTLRVPIASASLRNLPGLGSATGQRTLVLIDGKRIVPAGLEQAGVDLGIIPKGIIERTDIMLDGASAVYGSDAVEGVINIITRKRFKGTEVSGRVGFGDDYWQADASITQGFEWGSGGLTLNYEFSKNSNILNRDRGYTTPLNYIDFLTPQVSGATCDNPNVRVSGASGVFYSHRVDGTGLAAGPNYCAVNAYDTLTPAQELHSGFATFSQDLSDSLKFEMTGFYTHKVQEANTGPFTATSTVTAANPVYRATASLPGTHQVAYNLASVFGYEAGISRTTLTTWQINPELSYNFGDSGWQVRLSGGYGESSVGVFQQRLDAVTLPSLVATGAVNPYNILASTNLAGLRALRKDLNNTADFSYSQARLVADGPLFDLPGGEVRVALGAEWQRTSATRVTMDENFFTVRPAVSASDESKSLFAEVVAPIVGAENAMPGIYRLTFSASGRYDKYDKYDTFNPRFALTYQPAEWLTLRGNWSTSFRAPNVIDKMGQLQSTIRNVGAIQNPTNVDPRYNFSANASTTGTAGFRFLFLQGTDLNLRPETAESWSIGLDIDPPFAPGLRLSATYWNIDFKDAIQPPTSGALITPAFLIPNTPTRLCYAPPAVQGQPNTFSPGQFFGPLCTQAQIDAFIALAPTGPGAYATIDGTTNTVAALVDSRISNLGRIKASGIDVNARYFVDTKFGSIDASFNLAVPVRMEQQFYAGGPVTDELLRGTTPKYTASGTIGANIGEFRIATTIRHRAGYVPTTETPRLAAQQTIPGFTVVDLAMRYNFAGTSWLSDDLSLSLNVNNVFNSHPPYSLTAAGSVTNGATLGRTFILGFNKKFGGPAD